MMNSLRYVEKAVLKLYESILEFLEANKLDSAYITSKQIQRKELVSLGVDKNLKLSILSVCWYNLQLVCLQLCCEQQALFKNQQPKPCSIWFL